MDNERGNMNRTAHNLNITFTFTLTAVELILNLRWFILDLHKLRSKQTGFINYSTAELIRECD